MSDKTLNPDTTRHTATPLGAIVRRIETFITDYVTFRPGSEYSLPLALWIIHTFCFPSFDAVPYLIITAATRRAGKSRLGEMIAACCSNPESGTAMTGYTLFRIIQETHPTIIFDEAESLSNEQVNTMRQVINSGYRRGQTIPREAKGGVIVRYDTFCPKVFILIGSTYDTLRDRSIQIVMQRGEARKDFRFATVHEEGGVLREVISEAVKMHAGDIEHAYSQSIGGLSFLQDRDEEIWTSLFSIAKVFCPDRIVDLQRIASDICAEKTMDPTKYTESEQDENTAASMEYGRKALVDMWQVFVQKGAKTSIPSLDMLAFMKEIPTAPWRKYRGEGLSYENLANLVQRFGVKPMRGRNGNGRSAPSCRVYLRKQVEAAINAL